MAITQAEAQLRGLALLQRRVDTASPASLAAIRAEVAASVAATQAFVQQMQGIGSTVTAEKAALQQASEAARGSVTDFMHAYYDEHEFDRYLNFVSLEDREEYRKREEDRKHAIEKALAERTPEGNLRANQLAIEQLTDAGAHGANKSPDFKKRMDELKSSNRDLTAAIAANPKQQLSTVDPLDAAKPAGKVPQELAASLQASGVTVPRQDETGHGVTADATPSSNKARG